MAAALRRAGHRRGQLDRRHRFTGQPVAGRHLARPLPADAAARRSAFAPARISARSRRCSPFHRRGGCWKIPRRPSPPLLAHYPDAETVQLHPADVPFFVTLCKTLGKPVNFVPVIDKDVRRWWRSDSLWQAHDARYDADQVCIIPGTACGRRHHPDGRTRRRVAGPLRAGRHRRGAGRRSGAPSRHVAPAGPRRRDRTAGRRARRPRCAVGRPHRDQPGAPNRRSGRLAGARRTRNRAPHTHPPAPGCR